MKVENVSQDFKKTKILAVQLVPERTDGQRKFSDLHVKILYGGQLYIWGLKFNHPCYGALLDFFGPNTDGWEDQEFMLGLEVAEFDDPEKCVIGFAAVIPENWKTRSAQSLVDKICKTIDETSFARVMVEDCDLLCHGD